MVGERACFKVRGVVCVLGVGNGGGGVVVLGC